MAKAAKKSKKATVEVESPVVIESFKGFDKNLQCRGFQFEVGKTYNVTGKIKVCERGFHACSNPLDVWGYYGPGDSRFAIVEQSGDLSTETGDSKIASAQITIKAELTLPEFIQRSVAWIIKQVDFTNAPATNTGDRSAATNTGKEAVAMSSGYQGRVSGSDGCALFLVERDGIKPEVFYTLTDGKPVEWQEA